jgi:hypothetical protein
LSDAFDLITGRHIDRHEGGLEPSLRGAREIKIAVRPLREIILFLILLRIVNVGINDQKLPGQLLGHGLKGFVPFERKGAKDGDGGEQRQAGTQKFLPASSYYGIRKHDPTPWVLVCSKGHTTGLEGLKNFLSLLESIKSEGKTGDQGDFESPDDKLDQLDLRLDFIRLEDFIGLFQFFQGPLFAVHHYFTYPYEPEY